MLALALTADAGRGIPWALKFNNATTDRVNVGNCGGADPVAGSVWAWVYLTSDTNSAILDKGQDGATVGYWRFNHPSPSVGVNNFRFTVNYSTTNPVATAANNSAPLNQWLFLAGTFDGTTAPRLYAGALDRRVAEVSYATQTAPVGTRTTDSSGAMILGNRQLSQATTSFPGYIAAIGFVRTRVLTAADFNAFYRNLSAAPPMTGMWIMSKNGRGVVPDVSGHNCAGTITGAVPADVFLPQVMR